MLIVCATYYDTLQTSIHNQRKYDVVHSETSRQDKWEVETRRRQSGKMKGSCYKVWTSPGGQKFYSLKKAIAAGFDNKSEGTGDKNDDEGGKGKGNPKRQRRA